MLRALPDATLKVTVPQLVTRPFYVKGDRGWRTNAVNAIITGLIMHERAYF